MGWWWGKDPQKPVLDSTDSPPDPVPTPSEPPASPRELTDGPIPPPSSDAEVERELEKYLGITTSSDPKRKFDSVSRKVRESLGLHGAPSHSTAVESSASPEPEAAPPAAPEVFGPASIFPETMSCREAFDRAFYCNSLGGQVQNVYRYGSARDCKPNWGEFWFCMKLRTQPEAQKRARIREWYMRREAEVKLGPSSEGVWSVRKERLETAFDKDPDVYEED